MKQFFLRMTAVFVIVCGFLLSAAAAPELLIPGGCTVGVKLYTQGLMITGFEPSSAAKAAGLRKGDIIIEVDGTEVRTAAALRDSLGEEPVILTVLRNGKQARFCVNPREKQIGAYVRDSVAGIGTVTYYDPDTGEFGALGHGVSDGQTDRLIPMEAGVVVPSSVDSVKKGKDGSPGELQGKFDVNSILGEVEQNLDHGLFGHLTTPLAGKPLPVAEPDEVTPGPATILSNVDGTQVCSYDVEILKLYPHAIDTGRNLLLRITDQTLLNTTGGIVQGMSGSPIIQDGKLVGAVTHVLVNDPTRGYGIFIENMLDAAA